MIQGYTLATFPSAMQYIYAQPEKQAKELSIIGGEPGKQVFYPAIKRKTEKEKEGGYSQPSKHLERTTLSFV